MNQDKSKREIQLSETQKEILQGALLGDGSLSIQKNSVNAYFSYVSKSKQHVEYVASYFNNLITPAGIRYNNIYDSRTNKYYSSYRFITHTNKEFTKIHYKWYINKIKIIPQDLKLTPKNCLIWYIGDGGLTNNRCKYSQYIKLSTHCFSKQNQEDILLPQLKKFDAFLTKTEKNQWFINIPHKEIKNFLDYIGECPFNDYKYKWNYKEYKNKKPKNHTEKEQLFIELFKKGMTYYAIAKQFGIEPNAVKYYLIKNNLYHPNKK